MSERDTAPAPGAVTVTGRGRATGRPDTAVVTLGVEVRAATAVEALARANERATALIGTLGELGIAGPDLATRDVSLHPQYGDQGQQVVGYVAGNQVAATIRDVDRVGVILDAAAREVGDEVRFHGVAFAIRDAAELTRAARAAAMADAADTAGQLAVLAGRRLGEITSIVEASGGATPMPRFAKAMAMDSSVPIEAGSQSVGVDVTVTYRLSEAEH